jgi:hypothetical protein
LEYAMYGGPFISNTGGAKQGRNAENQEHTSKRKWLSAHFLYLPLRSGCEQVGSLPRKGDSHKSLCLFSQLDPDIDFSGVTVTSESVCSVLGNHSNVIRDGSSSLGVYSGHSPYGKLECDYTPPVTVTPLPTSISK